MAERKRAPQRTGRRAEDRTRRPVERDEQHATALRCDEENSTAAYEALARHIPTIFCALAPDGTTLDVSDAVTRITGYRPEELRGKDWWDVLYPGKLRRQVRDLYRCFEAGDVTDYEMVLQAKDGTHKTLAWSSANRRLPDRKLASILLLGFDITSRKQAELSLQRDAERFRKLVESTSDWVWEVDENGVYTYASPRVRDLLGYEPEEVIGRTPLDFMLPDEARRVAAIFGAIAAQRKPFTYLENTNRHKDGHRVVLETSGLPFFDKEGRFRGYRGIDRDITARKQIEQALRESEKRYRTLAEAAHDLIFIVDRDGYVRYVNDFAAHYFGLPPQDIVGKRRVDLFSPEVAEEQARNLQKVFETGEPLYSEELTPFCGTEVWLGTWLAPIRDDAGNVKAVMGISRDITARKHADKLRDEYVSIISHDLRAPLTVIQGQAQLLLRALDRAALEGPARHSAEAILTGARRMTTMIEELVDSARLEAGEITLKRVPIDLPAFACEVKERLAGAMPTERVRVEAPAHLPPVLADPDRLERILVNLLSNALKYSPPHSEVTVRIWSSRSEVTTSVTDRGQGIPPEDIPHIFQRYFRAWPARERREGLGLGLYITKGLVEAHGGRISLASRVGHGTTVCFTLPRA